MRARHPLWLFLAIAFFLGAGPFFARPVQGEALVDNVFFQTDLRTALEDISAQVETNIIADPSVQGIVSATVEGVPLDMALDILLAGTNFRYAKRSGYYLVYSPDTSSDLFAELSETEVVQTKNLPASTVFELLLEPLKKYVRVDGSSDRMRWCKILKDCSRISDSRRSGLTIPPRMWNTSPPS